MTVINFVQSVHKNHVLGGKRKRKRRSDDEYEEGAEEGSGEGKKQLR